MALCKVSKKRQDAVRECVDSSGSGANEISLFFESDDKRKRFISRKQLLLDKRDKKREMKLKKEETGVELFMCEHGG